jgi:methyltransferase (TIGR00027 family)
MSDAGPSRTAFSAALMRAIHARRDPAPLLDDRWGDRLVSETEKAALHERIVAGVDAEVRARLARLPTPEHVLDVVLRRHSTYGGVVLRSRWAEDALAAAVARGVGQYVLLGAGFDSFIVRQPAFAAALTIFEVDLPATQAMKRERLAAAGGAVPENVRFVAADLGREALPDVLTRGGFDGTRPAFFSWLGVTIYLTREANLATLQAVAAVSAPESEIAFTYVDERALEAGRSDLMDRLRAGPASLGEPWLSGFDPRTLPATLGEVGLELVEDLDGRALTARYCADRSDGLSAGVVGHVARARVLPR